MLQQSMLNDLKWLANINHRTTSNQVRHLISEAISDAKQTVTVKESMNGQSDGDADKGVQGLDVKDSMTHSMSVWKRWVMGSRT